MNTKILALAITVMMFATYIVVKDMKEVQKPIVTEWRIEGTEDQEINISHFFE